jgi:hypothetical protein
MVPSTPNRRGANPKRTWRQTQADVAPNPNPCQLFPIAAHCRFEPFQALGCSGKRHPAFALAAPVHLRENAYDSRSPVRARPSKTRPAPHRQARLARPPSFSDYCDYVGDFRLSQGVKRKKLWRIVNPAWSVPAAASAELARGVKPRVGICPGKSRGLESINWPRTPSPSPLETEPTMSAMKASPKLRKTHRRGHFIRLVGCFANPRLIQLPE